MSFDVKGLIVNIGLDHSSLPDETKQFPEPILIYQWH